MFSWGASPPNPPGLATLEAQHMWLRLEKTTALVGLRVEPLAMSSSNIVTANDRTWNIRVGVLISADYVQTPSTESQGKKNYDA